MHKRNLIILSIAVVLSGCADSPMTKEDKLQTKREQRYESFGKLFGEDALVFGGEKSVKKSDSGIGVNSYLWRATLDTLSFMPLQSVDPFGGVILTQWYTPKKSSGERLKIDVRILDRVLRADGLNISIFRQKYIKGRWVNLGVSPATKREIEDAILMRARKLKNSK